MPAQPSEADIIFNRASVALAKSQRLIASWLPPKTPEELANTKSEEELENEEKAIFTPVPELLGIGAPLPKDVADGSFKRRELSSNDKLLKQLLGKKAAKAAKAAKAHPATNSSKSLGPSQNLGSKPVKHPIRREESEDEEGRTSTFKSKRSKQKNISGSYSQDVQSPLETKSKKRGRLDMNGNDSDNTDGGDAIKGGVSSRQLKSTVAGPENKVLSKSTNYLDQVLAERSKKKKKKTLTRD